MSWRVVFMAIGLSFSAFAGGFMEWIGGGDAGYSTMSWVYASICLVTMLATVFAAPTLKTAATLSISLAEQFRVLTSSGRFMRLLAVGFLQKLGEGVGYGSFAYFCIYVALQPLTSMGLVVLAATIGQIIAQPFWLRASRRYAPVTLYTVAVLGWCLNLLLWLAMRGQSTWWLLPLGLQAGLAAGGLLMVTLGMLSNVLAADAAETGVNREGIFSGLWLAAEKLAFALGSLTVGVILGAFGFVESAHGQAVVQTHTAIIGIAITYCGVSMSVYLISIIAVRQFGRFAIAKA